MKKKEVNSKLILVLISTLLLSTIPILLVSNQEISNSGEQLPRTSQVNYVSLTGDAHGVYVSGDYAYLATRTEGLAVINVSDPTIPGTPVYEDTAGDARGVYVSGDFAYVADALSGLAIINVSDPTNPGTPVYEDTERPSTKIQLEMHVAFT